MTPQSNLMILAAIDPQREAELRSLLASMNREPGVIDPLNSLVPFGRFERLHFARILILDDQTLGDITVYGLPRVNYPRYLAILADFDGPLETFVAEFAHQAGQGLRRIFSHCLGYEPGVDFLAWMKARSTPAAASYVNWIGRTVQQVREEAVLRQALETYIQKNSASLRIMQPLQARNALRLFIAAEQQAGRITLTPPAAAPLGWKLRNLFNLVGVPLVLLLLSPILLLYLPFFLVQLRLRERSDPEVAPRVDPAHANLLASLEDHDVTNQFSAMGTLKPGLFRRLTTRFVLLVIDYTARHIFNRGRLARVTTIHFARWVFLDGRKRVIFLSNYDGSLESYMDDFINKVAFGLNVVFSNGIGYPRTNWLLLDGAKDEQKFKDFLRRHQMPTQVWYSACPGLTALERKRNALIRDGFEQSSMTDSAIKEWLQLF
ncbi:MAG TPA: hypothetical protein VND66_03260 [Acidobacteriaceae bacterium]|nr:hypothetical protein [Acidobacteriaceae bacterium]